MIKKLTHRINLVLQLIQSLGHILQIRDLFFCQFSGTSRRREQEIQQMHEGLVAVARQERDPVPQRRLEGIVVEHDDGKETQLRRGDSR